MTNGEWIEFEEAGGYDDATLWLSEGWDWVQRCKDQKPLYWRDNGEAFTLGGRRAIDRAAPVSHVSYYEADAFARWAGARLPTEFEWEDAFASADPNLGNQLDRAGRGAAAARRRAVWRCVAVDPERAICPTPASSQPRARSANIMASSCAGSSC